MDALVVAITGEGSRNKGEILERSPEHSMG